METHFLQFGVVLYRRYTSADSFGTMMALVSRGKGE